MLKTKIREAESGVRSVTEPTTTRRQRAGERRERQLKSKRVVLAEETTPSRRTENNRGLEEQKNAIPSNFFSNYPIDPAPQRTWSQNREKPRTPSSFKRASSHVACAVGKLRGNGMMENTHKVEGGVRSAIEPSTSREIKTRQGQVRQLRSK